MFTLDQVVPWGRSFEEYRRMFALTDGDLSKNVLDCAGGPASFNAESARRGHRVISVDPLYRWSHADIDARIAATYAEVISQTRANADSFVWNTIGSVDELGRVRMEAMRTFLEDFEGGRGAGRYVEGALPTLPFGDRQFDLAVSSHFLFLYSAHFDEGFHLSGLLELCRVATEVRVFPLLTLGGELSPHLEGCVEGLARAGFSARVVPVSYEFQRGGNAMLQIVRTAA